MELNSAYLASASKNALTTFWNSFWMAKSYTAFHCTYSLSMVIFLNMDISQGSV